MNCNCENTLPDNMPCVHSQRDMLLNFAKNVIYMAREKGMDIDSEITNALEYYVKGDPLEKQVRIVKQIVQRVDEVKAITG